MHALIVFTHTVRVTMHSHDRSLNSLCLYTTDSVKGPLDWTKLITCCHKQAECESDPAISSTIPAILADELDDLAGP